MNKPTNEQLLHTHKALNNTLEFNRSINNALMCKESADKDTSMTLRANKNEETFKDIEVVSKWLLSLTK